MMSTIDEIAIEKVVGLLEELPLLERPCVQLQPPVDYLSLRTSYIQGDPGTGGSSAALAVIYNALILRHSSRKRHRPSIVSSLTLGAIVEKSSPGRDLEASHRLGRT